MAVQTAPLAYSVDVTRLPLLVVRPTAHVKDDQALDATYVSLERVLALEVPLLLLLDMRGGASTPKRRQRLQSWQKARKEQTARAIRAIAVVVGSQLERGFVTAALWLVTPSNPMRVFTEPRDAEAWLLTHAPLPTRRSS